MNDPTPTLEAIRQSVQAHSWAPSLTELSRATGRNVTAVRIDLARLEGAGLIERGRGARQIRLTDATVGGAA